MCDFQCASGIAAIAILDCKTHGCKLIIFCKDLCRNRCHFGVGGPELPLSDLQQGFGQQPASRLELEPQSSKWMIFSKDVYCKRCHFGVGAPQFQMDDF